MIPQLLKIIRESIKAVPAMKYALAIAGILAVVALVGAFKLSPQTAILGSVITLVLMVAMVVFARLTTTASRHFVLPAQVMMWAFLLVTVATAFLLFTSAFFRWPRGLRELLDPKPAPVVTGNAPDPVEVQSLITAAQQQRSGRDHAGAWATISRAVTVQPDSSAAREEQVQVAMAWIRDMVVREPETFSNLLRPLTQCLQVRAATAKGELAADIHAHLGWANFCRQSKERVMELKVEEFFETAVTHDATNPFAHAMWGHVLADRRRPVGEMNRHFKLALTSGREREFVQHMRVTALIRAETSEARAELLRVMDEMRRAGDVLASTTRPRARTTIYSRLSVSDEAALLPILPPADQLATFRWLVDAREIAQSAELSYFHARLIEGTGNLDEAASQYRALLTQDIPRFEERAKAGLARCEQRSATRR
jgi:hypothetical protein